jgi:hypothetical protein
MALSFINVLEVHAIDDAAGRADLRVRRRLPSAQISFAAVRAIPGDRRWQLNDVADGFRRAGKTVSACIESIDWQSVLDPALLSVLLVKPDQMSAWSLYSYSQHLKENRQKALRYEIALWSKLMYPLAVLVMMMLALPFAYFQRRQGGVGAKIFAGIMLGLGFHFFNRLFGHLGLLNDWPAVAAPCQPHADVPDALRWMMWWQERSLKKKRFSRPAGDSLLLPLTEPRSRQAVVQELPVAVDQAQANPRPEQRVTGTREARRSASDRHAALPLRAHEADAPGFHRQGLSAVRATARRNRPAARTALRTARVGARYNLGRRPVCAVAMPGGQQKDSRSAQQCVDQARARQRRAARVAAGSPKRYCGSAACGLGGRRGGLGRLPGGRIGFQVGCSSARLVGRHCLATSLRLSASDAEFLVLLARGAGAVPGKLRPSLSCASAGAAVPAASSSDSARRSRAIFCAGRCPCRFHSEASGARICCCPAVSSDQAGLDGLLILRRVLRGGGGKRESIARRSARRAF